MRMLSRVAAAGAAALVAACLWRTAVRAGGGLPEGDGKPVEPVRPGTTPERDVISLTPAKRPAGDQADAGAQRKRLRAAQVVPKDAALYACVADVSRVRSAAGQLAVANVLAEKAVEPYVTAFLKRLRGPAGAAPEPGLSGLVRTVLSMRVDLGAASAAFRKEIALVGLPPAGEDGAIRLAIVAPFGVASQKPLAEMMDNLIGELHARYPGAYEPEREARGGSEIQGLKLEGVEISYAFHENLFLFGTGKDTLAALIDSELAGPESQLAGDASFARAEEDLGRGADVFYRVDLGGLSRGLKQMAGAAAGTARTGVLSGSIFLDGAAVRERIEARAPEGQRLSPLKLGEPLAIPPKSIDYFPVDTAFYAAVSLESAEDMAGIGKDPQVGVAMQQLGQFVQRLGIDAARDVVPALPAFGGEAAVGVVLPRGRPAELLIVLEVKKKALLVQAEEAVKKLAGGQMKEVSYRGVDIRYAEPPKTLEEATVTQYLLPSLACARVGHDLFMVASSLRAMEKAVRQRSFPQSSLREKEDFRRCLDGLKPRRTSVLYVNVRGCLEALGGPVIAPIGAEVPTGLEGSETVAALGRHLFGLGVISGATQESSFLESSGPLGPVTGAGLGALALLQSALDQGGADSPEQDAENLTRIGVALHLYATDFDRFPVQLSELYDEYLADLKYFMTPGGKKEVKSKDDIDERSDYIYVSGLSPSDLSDTVVAYSRKPLRAPFGTGRNVLYLNGRVDFVREGKIEGLLKEAASR